MQGAKGIDHHRQFVGPLRIATRGDRTWVGAMGDPVRVQGDRIEFDTSPTPELTGHVVEEFVRFDIAVRIRNLDGLRMGIEHPRCKGAYDEPVGLERLMDGWGLMDHPGNRLEIQSVEGEWID